MSLLHIYTVSEKREEAIKYMVEVTIPKSKRSHKLSYDYWLLTEKRNLLSWNGEFAGMHGNAFRAVFTDFTDSILYLMYQTRRARR